MLPPVTSWPPNLLIPSRCPCESRPLVDDPPPFLCAMKFPLRNLDVADLNGSVILPVPAQNIVLPARFILQRLQFRTAALFHNLADDLNFRDIFSRDKLLLVRVHRDHIFKRDLAAQFSFERFHAYRLARLHAVLLSPTANHGVHAAS